MSLGRRTELRRGSGLRTGTGLQRRSALRTTTTLRRVGSLAAKQPARTAGQSKRKTPAPSRFSQETKALIYARDHGRCQACGQLVTRSPWGYSFQHRIRAGMGGSKAWYINSPANGILLCGSGTTGCHGRIETTAEGGQMALEVGWALPRNQPGIDPADHPVATPRGWMRLTHDGHAIPCAAPERAA